MSLMDEARKVDFRCADTVGSKIVFEWIKTGQISLKEFSNWLAHYEQLCHNEAHEENVILQRRL